MIFQTSCAYNLGIAKFRTWFTPFLEGSFITGYKEIRIGLQLAETIWLPPHRALFGVSFFSKILVPNLTTRTIYQAPVKIRGQSSLAIAGHGSRLHAETPPCPMATCGEVGAQALVTTSTLGLGSGCSCLGGHCWRKRGSSQWSCYMDIMEVLGTLQMEKHVFDRHWNLEPLD